MYKLTYELREATGGDGRRDARSSLLPLSYSITSALVEVADVLSRETYRLHTLTLEELHVRDNQYCVKATLVRYEREGL